MKKRMLPAIALALSLIAWPHVLQAKSVVVTHSAFPVTIVDDLHNKVRIPKLPRRIISLDPRDTETLFALGVEKRVVADGSKYAEGAAGINRAFRFPGEWPSQVGRNYPTLSKTLPHIEGGFGTTPFDLETILKLRPDLIFSLNSDRPTLDRMRSLGLKVVVLDPSTIKGILHDISLVGRATGSSSQASRVISVMDKQLAVLKARMSRVHSRPSVYYEIDATNPLEPYTAGAGTFIDESIRIDGGKNVGAAATTCSGTTCYPQFTLESLVRLNPQIIVLGDSQYGVSAGDVKGRTGWSTISAVQSGKIYPFDDELISRAGPRIMIGLQKLGRLIHPEAF